MKQSFHSHVYAALLRWGQGAVVLGAFVATAQSAMFSVVEQGQWLPDLETEVGLVRVLDNRAYLGATTSLGPDQNESTLQILDVSDPARPALARKETLSGRVYDLAVSGQYVYVLTQYGMEVLDLARPSGNAPVGRYAQEDLNAVDLANQYAVVVHGEVGFLGPFDSGISIVDVSDAARPARVGGLFLPQFDPITGEIRVDFSGEEFLSSEPTAVKIAGEFAFVADNTFGLHVIDISAPGSPTRVASYFLGAMDIWHPSGRMSLELVGERAYLAHSDLGLHVFDVSNPAVPVRIGGYYAQWGYRALRVAGTTAFLAVDRFATEFADVDVIDMANPIRPVHLATLNRVAPLDLELAADKLYLAAGSQGLFIYQFSMSPQPPAALSMICTNGAWRLQWPATAQGFVVEFTPSLGPNARWQPLEGSILPVREANSLAIEPQGRAGFFRLRKLSE